MPSPRSDFKFSSVGWVYATRFIEQFGIVSPCTIDLLTSYYRGMGFGVIVLSCSAREYHDAVERAATESDWTATAPWTTYVLDERQVLVFSRETDAVRLKLTMDI